jgi:hypothetical protein
MTMTITMKALLAQEAMTMTVTTTVPLVQEAMTMTTKGKISMTKMIVAEVVVMTMTRKVTVATMTMTDPKVEVIVKATKMTKKEALSKVRGNSVMMKLEGVPLVVAPEAMMTMIDTQKTKGTLQVVEAEVEAKNEAMSTTMVMVATIQMKNKQCMYSIVKFSKLF